MAKLPPDKQRTLDAIQGSLHRMALKLLEAPASERETVYEIMRESFKETAKVASIDQGFEEQYMIWLRALVDMIERSGGAKGGAA